MMSFIRVERKGRRTYYSLVEGFRENGKVRQRVLEWYGINPPLKALEKVKSGDSHNGLETFPQQDNHAMGDENSHLVKDAPESVVRTHERATPRSRIQQNNQNHIWHGSNQYCQNGGNKMEKQTSFGKDFANDKEIVLEVKKPEPLVHIPDDVYHVILSNVEKVDFGNGDTLVLDFEIKNGQYAGKTIRGFCRPRITLSSKLCKWLTAMGVPIDYGMKIDMKSLIGVECRATTQTKQVTRRNGENVTVSNVSDVLPSPLSDVEGSKMGD